jgi:hypothetical protein
VARAALVVSFAPIVTVARYVVSFASGAAGVKVAVLVESS